MAMKVPTSRGKAHISVSSRANGAGCIVQQSTSRVIMSWQEWREVRDAIDALYANQPPKRVPNE